MRLLNVMIRFTDHLIYNGQWVYNGANFLPFTTHTLSKPLLVVDTCEQSHHQDKMVVGRDSTDNLPRKSRRLFVLRPPAFPKVAPNVVVSKKTTKVVIKPSGVGENVGP